MQPAVLKTQSAAAVWTLAAILLALAPAHQVAAQFPREVTARTRVRVMAAEPAYRQYESDDGWVVGDVARVTVDTLYIRVDSATALVAIPRTGIQRMQRSLGTRTLSTCTRTGQAIAAVLGGWLLVVGFTSNEFGTREGAALLIGFWGGIIDGLSRSECWRNVRLR